MGKSVKEQLAILEKTRAREFQNYQNTGQGPSWVKKQASQAPGASSQELAKRSVSGNWNTNTGSKAPANYSSSSGPNLQTAIAENTARENARQAAIKADEDKKKEQDRFESVSKAEGEKRRKELEASAGAAGAAATGGQAFLKKEERKTGFARTSQPSTVTAISPSAVQGTILGLPKDTKVFTKFGESINRAANLTFSSPETRFGGM
jgi:hypothetical protein